jgi:hypothetical protein
MSGFEGSGMVVARAGARAGFEEGVGVGGGGAGFEVTGCDIVVAFCDVVDVAPASFKVPFAATCCSILLVAGDTGVAFAGLEGVFTVASAFFVAGFAAFAVAFRPFFTASPGVLGVFAAFVEACLVPVFLISSTTSSATFFGRPRFLMGSVVDIVVN